MHLLKNIIFCVPIDPCEPDPCYNDGKCQTEETGYTCQCLLGYHGNQCEIGKP